MINALNVYCNAYVTYGLSLRNKRFRPSLSQCRYLRRPMPLSSRATYSACRSIPGCPMTLLFHFQARSSPCHGSLKFPHHTIVPSLTAGPRSSRSCSTQKRTRLAKLVQRLRPKHRDLGLNPDKVDVTLKWPSRSIIPEGFAKEASSVSSTLSSLDAFAIFSIFLVYLLHVSVFHGPQPLQQRLNAKNGPSLRN
ncbi:hypothetical protein EDB85DRAFT_1034815 [Lactarius pseudohatsudake]|nr:hypothetical protein EDB85DRAFT_1034815 [Lactarius pseudohatsudake]